MPSLRQSGKRTAARAGIGPLGHARLRQALWVPVLGAVRRNDWLRPFYERLRAAGKPAKLAVIAAMHKLLCAIYSVANNRKPFTIAPAGRNTTCSMSRYLTPWVRIIHRSSPIMSGQRVPDPAIRPE